MEYRAYLFEEIEPVGIICNRGKLIDTAQIKGDGRRKPERWRQVAERIFFEERDWTNKEEYFIELEQIKNEKI
jgi:hypothetical protein